MPTLHARPLTVDAYAPFGEILTARDTPGRSANQGTARVWDRLVALENQRAGARLNASVFRCQPRALPLNLSLLEKHPRSTQLFVPMTPSRFVVVVALGADRPDLDTLCAFVCGAGQGVSYRAGVWHHPMLVLDEPADFACFVHEDDGEEDCVVVALNEPVTLAG